MTLAARVLLRSAFLVSGLLKLVDFPSAVAEVGALFKLEPAALLAALVIRTQLDDSALLIAGGRIIWMGAALLAGFTLLSTLASHPAVSTERLSLTAQGNIRYRLKTPYRDGTTDVVFEPLEFMARLAALVPAPRVNLTRYHGVNALYI